MPDAATAGGSAEAVCGQSLSGVDAAVFLVAILLNTKFVCGMFLFKLHAQLEVGSVRARQL